MSMPRILWQVSARRPTPIGDLDIPPFCVWAESHAHALALAIEIIDIPVSLAYALVVITDVDALEAVERGEDGQPLTPRSITRAAQRRMGLPVEGERP